MVEDVRGESYQGKTLESIIIKQGRGSPGEGPGAGVPRN